MDQLKAALAASTAIKEIAHRILRSTGPRDLPIWCRTAQPYLVAIRNNDYGMEDPVMCVLYALNNMVSWKGELAREVKQSLNEAIHEHIISSRT
jgi:hypothetical protein